MLSRILCFVFIATLGISCNNPRKSQQQGQKSKPREALDLNKNGEATNKIAFLTFEVSLADSVKDEYSFRLIKTSFANGTLKKELSAGQNLKDPGYLYYQVEGNSELSRPFLKVNDPLKMILEYPGENGSLGKQTFLKKRGEMTIRFQFEKDIKTISIYKTDSLLSKLKKVYYASL